MIGHELINTLYPCIDLQSADGHTYKLYGVIVHYGRTMFVGHYVAFIKINGVWLLFDDDRVCLLSIFPTLSSPPLPTSLSKLQ